jgi:uncharacterized protein (DUF1778 family)
MKQKRRNPIPVRLNLRERELIDQAAELLDVSVSEFLRVSAVNRAKTTITKSTKGAILNEI